MSYVIESLPKALIHESKIDFVNLSLRIILFILKLFSLRFMNLSLRFMNHEIPLRIMNLICFRFMNLKWHYLVVDHICTMIWI